jgi:acetoin utilization deacetylase AcuC-like enzyme
MRERLAVFYDARVLEHDTGEGFFEAAASPYLPRREPHPENGLRLENMAAVLREGPIAAELDWQLAPAAAREDLERFHEPGYIDELASIPVDQSRVMSSTTVFGPNSFEICRIAAGQAIAAVEHAFADRGPAYALLRPPGHHAQPAVADGYCFINNIGVAIECLRARGLTRAAVIDWDVHHGNGTQAGFYADPGVLTISLHMPHGAWGETHPQSGDFDERGEGAGLGKNLNLPLPHGSGDIAYARVFDAIVAPAVRAHAPEILVVACGQDANQFDPNGRLLLSMAGFYELGRRARALADECCGGRLALVQEGGYQLSYAAYCLHATLEGVLGREPGLADPIAFMPENADGLDVYIDAARAALAL